MSRLSTSITLGVFIALAVALHAVAGALLPDDASRAETVLWTAIQSIAPFIYWPGILFLLVIWGKPHLQRLIEALKRYTTPSAAPKVEAVPDEVRAGVEGVGHTMARLHRKIDNLDERRAEAEGYLQEIDGLVDALGQGIRVLVRYANSLVERKQRIAALAAELKKEHPDPSQISYLAGALGDATLADLASPETLPLYGTELVNLLSRKAGVLDTGYTKMIGLAQAWVVDLSSYVERIEELRMTLVASNGLPLILAVQNKLITARNALQFRDVDEIKMISILPAPPDTRQVQRRDW